jgi:chorismate-pyruvate lyase
MVWRVTSLEWSECLSPPCPITSRTYELIVHGNPAMLISEHFVWQATGPTGLFQAL